MTTGAQILWLKRSSGIVLLWCSLLVPSGCSTPQAPPPNPDQVRQHSDQAFRQLHGQEQPQAQTDTPSQMQSPATSDQPAAQAPSNNAGAQIPLAEIIQSNDGYVRATGYGDFAKGLNLCQHSADLAARVELSKLIRVKVTERSTDRIRERTGKEAEQDIEIVREGLVNEVLVRGADCGSQSGQGGRHLFEHRRDSEEKPQPHSGHRQRRQRQSAKVTICSLGLVPGMG